MLSRSFSSATAETSSTSRSGRARQAKTVVSWRYAPVVANAALIPRELLDTHWRDARESADEEGRFAIGFKVAVKDGVPAKLKVTSRISTTITEAPSGARQPAEGGPQGSAAGRRWQIESTVDDPNQPQLL